MEVQRLAERVCNLFCLFTACGVYAVIARRNHEKVRILAAAVQKKQIFFADLGAVLGKHRQKPFVLIVVGFETVDNIAFVSSAVVRKVIVYRVDLNLEDIFGRAYYFG